MTTKSKKSIVRVLIDIDAMLVSITEKNNKRGIYWTACNLIKEFIANKDLQITFITNRFSTDLYKQLCKEEPVFKNFECITEKYENKFFTYIVANRIKFRKRKRNSRGLKSLVNFVCYIFFTILVKLKKVFDFVIVKPILIKFDVYQSMFYRIPDSIMKNPKIKKKCILVHDAIPLIDNFGKIKIESISRRNFLNIFKNLDENVIFFCNSSYTREEFLRFFPKYRDNRIIVAPLAANKKQFYRIENEDVTRTNETLSRYGIPTDRKYILSICALDLRKNLRSLIVGFDDFLKSNSIINDLCLVLAGPYGTSDARLTLLKTRSKKLQTRIITTGYIDKNDINIVYNKAFCFAFLSFYEGFGLPILEAMQCGIPVISSNTSSMPEVYGDSAIGVDPNNKDEFLRALRKIYFDMEARNTFIAKGLERSKLFSWDITAKIFIDEYKKID
ncbi:MAG: glycosyltransferase family 4 protein [Rickettsiales bacterium]|jgi:glycosyltransferase involved in cell wall biosynthesis|nr:glycosyltransferase family 4 protein [Rickettsiales bacterium]